MHLSNTIESGDLHRRGGNSHAPDYIPRFRNINHSGHDSSAIKANSIINVDY